MAVEQADINMRDSIEGAVNLEGREYPHNRTTSHKDSGNKQIHKRKAAWPAHNATPKTY